MESLNHLERINRIKSKSKLSKSVPDLKQLSRNDISNNKLIQDLFSTGKLSKEVADNLLVPDNIKSQQYVISLDESESSYDQNDSNQNEKKDNKQDKLVGQTTMAEPTDSLNS